MTSLNIGKLQELSHENKTAKALFETLANRERARAETHIPRLFMSMSKQDSQVEKATLFRLFQEFENLGLGQLIFSRHGKPQKFKWKYNLVSIAKTVKGSQSEPVLFKTRKGTVLPKLKLEPMSKYEAGTEEKPNIYQVFIKKGDVEVSTPIPTNEVELKSLVELISRLK